MSWLILIIVVDLAILLVAAVFSNKK